MIETKNLRIRRILPTEIEYFRCVSEINLPELKKLKKGVYEAFIDDAFKSIIASFETEIFLIFERASNKLCGKLELQHYEEGDELGIALLEKFRNIGIGPESIIGFGKWLAKEKGLKEIKVRIDPENKHSLHIFEKLGAKFIEQKSGLSNGARKALEKQMTMEEWDRIGPYFYRLSLPIEI